MAARIFAPFKIFRCIRSTRADTRYISSSSALKRTLKSEGFFPKFIGTRGADNSSLNALKIAVLVLSGFYLYFYFNKDKFKTKTDSFGPKTTLRERFNFIADVVEQTANAVVCIKCKASGDWGMVRYLGGSGFIVSPDGYILTNAHIVSTKIGENVHVQLKDGKTYMGVVVDSDPNVDLAIIKIQTKDLPTLPLGSTKDIRAGEWVIAIGSPLNLSDSITAGIISSANRHAVEIGVPNKDMLYIQTDASITFGNSGGPLVNLNGEVVGVNTMTVAPGISFAIPVEYVKEFLLKDRKSKRPQDESKPYIGTISVALTPGLKHELKSRNIRVPDFIDKGILICGVLPDSPAHRGGLLNGDIICEIDGKEIRDSADMYNEMMGKKVVIMKVFRGGQLFMLRIMPGVSM